MKNNLRSFNKGIFWIVFLLVVFGIVMISSASAVLSYERFESTNVYFFRQLSFAAVGLVLMYVFSRLDYLVLKKYSVFILAGAAVLLGLVLIPGIGVEFTGSRRWIDLGFTNLQPSEFAKPALIFFLAAWFDTRAERVKSFYYGLLPPLAITAVIAFLILLEPDFGSMSALVLVAVSIFFAAGVKGKHLIMFAVAAVLVSVIAIQAAPYRMARITSFVDPSSDPLGAGYQINQARLAVGSGGFWGQGFGYSRQKFSFLPEPIGDSIFAVISEELGFLRVSFVLILFLILFLLGYKAASKAPDAFGKYTAVGITSWFMIQTIFNVGAMIGFLPLTGIPLPFISYGGSAMVSSLIGAGVLLNISRWK